MRNYGKAWSWGLLMFLCVTSLVFMGSACKNTTPDNGGGGTTNVVDNGGGGVNWVTFYPLFETASYTGVKVYLMENPGEEAKFKPVVTTLDALIKDKMIDPAALTAALQQLPIKQLKDPIASMSVGIAVSIWNSYGQKLVVGNGTVDQIRQVAIRIRNGIGLALGMDPITAPVDSTKQRMKQTPENLKKLSVNAPKPE